MSWYLMGLENGTEYLEAIGNGCMGGKAGALVVAFSNVDWAGLEEKCETLRDTYENPRNLSIEFALWYQQLCRMLEPLHPLLSDLVRQQLVGDMKNILMEHISLGIDTPEWQYVTALETGEPVQSIMDALARLFIRQFSTRFNLPMSSQNWFL